MSSHTNDDMGMVYNKAGDYWTYFWKEEKCHAEKIDNKITLYKTQSGETIGIKIQSEFLNTFVKITDN